MDKMPIPYEVLSSTFKVASSVGKLLLVGYQVTKDGFQAGQDIPALWHEVSADVLPIFPLVKLLPAEMEAAPADAIFAALCGLYGAYKTVMG